MRSTAPFLQKNWNDASHIQSRNNQNDQGERGFRLGSSGFFAFFQFGSGGLAFDIALAAFAFQYFVILASHNSLLCSRDAVLS
jgi:hypothetical protein